MREPIIITPCLLVGGNAGAIVATSANVYPISMPAEEVGKFVQTLFDQLTKDKEDCKKPAKIV